MVSPTSTRLSKKVAFLVGAAGGLAMTVSLLTLRFALETQVITEVLADWFTSLLPGRVFDYLLETFQFNAKWILFSGLLVGQVVVGGLLGIAYVRWAPIAESDGRRLAHAAIITIVLWVVLAGAVTPIADAGAFGGSLPDGAFRYSASLLVSVAVFGLVITQLPQIGHGGSGVAYSAGRREFLRRTAVVAVVLVLGGFAVRTIASGLSRITPSPMGKSGEGISPEITPNEDFYVVAKSFLVPDVDSSSWRLKVEGDFANPFELDYEELLAMPAVEQFVTLTCISNPVGGYLMGNALWKGVRLKQVLERAGLPEGTERIAFFAADGYADSFPLEVAMRENVLIAYEMNGVPLPPEHGFPARIIVPGLYGMENVKWLESIQPVPESFRGYWQKRGWGDTAVIKTTSRFDFPDRRDDVFTTGALVGGVAFAGTRGVDRVEVSFDDGQSWEDAELSDPLSPYAWRIWTREWQDPKRGKHEILVRATDGNGDVQVAKATDNFPNGPTGYHTVTIEVVDPPEEAPADVSA